MTQQPPTQEVNYKETLNLPVTHFPMKAGAAKREPEIEAFWASSGVYAKSLATKNKSHKFILHDGPPYLSSDKIHIGTALNKILKDIVTRYKSQRGFYSPYVPGYDGHGLPIENAVVKSLKGGRQSVTPVQLRKLCREFAHKNLVGQEENFKRLGVWGNWEKPYCTIDAAFEATQIKVFGELYKKNFVYKGLKPVYWCPSCETALADAEVEYANHTSHSVYVAFPVKSDSLEPLRKTGQFDPKALDFLSNASFIIWTTTPWTLPANLALSVHPEFVYVVVQSPENQRWVIAKELLESVQKALKIEDLPVLAEFKGKDFLGLTTQHPFIERDSLILTGTHVTTEAGTGVVHTAPGHGMEDYVVVQQHNLSPAGKLSPLPILSPLDNRGVFTEEAQVSSLLGVFYEKANPMVVEILTEKGRLLFANQFDHSYPHCWRCHKPVIYRATEQWFINVDSFRDEALKAIRSVDWVPARGEARITSMVEGRGDWCISRQRVWGVPIPAFYCESPSCGKEIITQETTQHLNGLFHQHTSDIWWEWSAQELLPQGFACPTCGHGSFRKETDIMDVWFDSGITHTAVVEARSEELGSLPVELYLEGSDQHRGWFQSSLLTSVMLTHQAPFKSVLTHGFVLDEHGRKMSKSLGNVVDPHTIIQQYGADVLRLWVASVDYTNDVRIGAEIVSHLAEVYKKVRNTVRYMMGNLYDFDPQTDGVPYEELSLLDQYILSRLAHVVSDITQAFDVYEFHRYYQVLQNFCVVDLSSHYFDPVKDILYTYPKKGTVRRGVQTVLYEILMTLIGLLVPVMPHLADDIWMNLPENQKTQWPDSNSPLDSALLLPWPSLPPSYENMGVQNAMKPILEVKDLLNKAMESLRSEGKLKSSLEVSAVITCDTAEGFDLLNTHRSILPVFWIVSAISIEVKSSEKDSSPLNPDCIASQRGEGVEVQVFQAEGEKCQRCLKFVSSVGSHPAHQTLCSPCIQAIEMFVS